MNKNKLTQIKKNIKHHTPEIIVGLSVTTAIAATLWYNQTSRLWLNVPKESLEYLRDGGEMVFKVKGHQYLLIHAPNSTS